MTHHRLPYDDAETMREMTIDCHEVGHNLHLERIGMTSHPSELLGEQPAPASARLHSRYEVSDDLADMADDLELHLD
jgi:hypothetical protein